ncbi:MAG TPA: (2Fe-2S)-binding protein [Xanthobacteraceae bacterium]|jgi:xanthine dehydrogenase YagT iron-sulfur-binding subunit
MTDRDSRTPISGSSRREFLLVGASTVAAPALARAATTESPPVVRADPRAAIAVTLSVNGRVRRIALDPRTTLLDALREHLGLTGTKKGCDHGQCGACTVMLGEHRVLSCLTLAASVQGRAVTTIEGLVGPDGELHPMQQAFVDQDAFQCGYCTPGQIMSAVACIHEGHANNDGDIREYMSGNICRCAAYPNIVAAVKQAKAAMAAAPTGSGD